MRRLAGDRPAKDIEHAPRAALELSDNVGRLTSFAPAELDYSVEDPGAIGVRAAERERRLGVTRQSLIKLWLADRLEQPR